MLVAAGLDDPARLADLAASNLDLKLDEAQKILETLPGVDRLKAVLEILRREIRVLTVQQEISGMARGEIDKSQREYFLRQQLKAIQQELGVTDDVAEEVDQYRKKLEGKTLPPEATEEVEKQLKRLERSNPDSAETAMIRTFLDWITGLPWGVFSQDNLELARARTILDEDHYGLEKPKERILEFLAVRKLAPDSKGPILCFVGPPGVGKTSLGKSIARSLDRKFIQMSLGGVRDEAEIRGHRRTYVGALPGRIVQGINQAATSNPVFILDEVDKIGADFRGDPSSALLEVLDPEQNRAFRDHYLGVPYDLSKVLFITTANVLDTIQPAFLDRMEVIRLSGYTLEEKLAIAKRHLVPKQLKENGLTAKGLAFPEDALRTVIEEYTREAGLRNLEREIGSCCRKVAVRIASGDARAVKMTPALVRELLGVPKFRSDEALTRDEVGAATGLAWTAVGGDVLIVEARALKGKGRLQLTGPARRRHEGVGPGGAHAPAVAGEGAGPLPRLLRDARRPRPRSRGGDPEGRAVGRRDDAHRDGLRLHRHAREAGPRDDGRDHAPRRGASDRRPEGKGARRPPRRASRRSSSPPATSGTSRKSRRTFVAT